MLKWYLRYKFDLEARLEFYNVLISYAKDGVNLGRYISSLHERNLKKKNLDATMTGEWVKRRQESAKMGEMLDGWASASEKVILDSVGESLGGQVKALEQCIFLMNALKEMKSKMMAALKTLALWFGIIFGFIYAYTTYFLPVLAETFGKDYVNSFPFTHQANWLSNNLDLIVLGVVLLAFWVTYSIGKFPPGAFRKNILDYIPPYNIYKTYNSSTLIVTLSAMMESGINMSRTLELLKEGANPWLKYYVQKMVTRHNDGRYGTGDVLAVEDFFDEEIMNRIIDYGATGSFESQVGVIGKRAVKDSIKRMEVIEKGTDRVVQLIFILVALWLIANTGLIVAGAV